MEWISELFERIACALAIKVVLARLARAFPRVKGQIVAGYFRNCYYPGSTLMSFWCWFRHPISEERRADAEFSAGWNWSDPDETPSGVG